MRLRWGAVTALSLLSIVTGCAADDGLAERQRQVAERGAEVMPFDLEVTTHHFQETDDGLVQRVVADDPADRQQVRLVRAHLRDEARRFAGGDFADPRAIHGDDMPGVRELSRNAAHLEIEFRLVPAGAEITYRASSHTLVEALHAWAAAQVSDHGPHAGHG